jgi:hypothetical protein
MIFPISQMNYPVGVNMKIQWSVFFSLLLLVTLVGCGSEQFGSVPQSTKTLADPLTSFANNACSTYTLIKPKVDVLYVVDNSSSSYYISSDIKTALSNTVNSLSSSFDYRVIGTPLIESVGGNNDYQVMTNSSDLQGIPSDSRRISSAGNFSFFSSAPVSGVEKGLGRVISFVDHHKNSLIRNNSYLIVVLVSNGRDLEVEEDSGFGNGETRLNAANYNARLTSFMNLKSSLNSLQLRMISVSAKSVCSSGYRTALKSYVKMSNDLYVEAKAQDNNAALDSYDLCSSGGVSSIFSAINNSIQQVVLPHQYRYWPITFAENNEMVSTAEIKVQKISPNGASATLARDTDWFYEDRGSAQTVNTRELPTEGEPVTGRHFIRFANLVTYPDCVLVTSISRTEYFGYIVLPQKPKIETVSLRINGRVIPQSSTNGWSDMSSAPTTRNIKVPYPAAGDENPPLIRTGFMLQLNDPVNYYKSGDSVEVNFIPAGI